MKSRLLLEMTESPSAFLLTMWLLSKMVIPTHRAITVNTSPPRSMLSTQETLIGIGEER